MLAHTSLSPAILFNGSKLDGPTGPTYAIWTPLWKSVGRWVVQLIDGLQVLPGNEVVIDIDGHLNAAVPELVLDVGEALTLL